MMLIACSQHHIADVSASELAALASSALLLLLHLRVGSLGDACYAAGAHCEVGGFGIHGRSLC